MPAVVMSLERESFGLGEKERLGCGNSEAREALGLGPGLGFTDVTAERRHRHHALDALQLLLHKLAVEESLHVLLRAELLVEARIAAEAEVRHQPAPLGRAGWAGTRVLGEPRSSL